MMDPWRFRCPECGSTQVTKRSSYGDNTTVKGGYTADSRYYCRGCKSSIDTRLDVKTGKEVA